MGSLIYRQRGMTLLGLLWAAGLAWLFGLFLVKLGPVYANHYKVRSALESIQQDKSLPAKSKQDILMMLEKRWQIDSVEDLSRDNVTITQQGDNGVRVEVAYDVIRNMFRNVDVIVHFKDAIEVGSN